MPTNNTSTICNVEVSLLQSSTVDSPTVENAACKFLYSNFIRLRPNQLIPHDLFQTFHFLNTNIEYFQIADILSSTNALVYEVKDLRFNVFVYKMNKELPSNYHDDEDEDEEDGNDRIVSFNQYSLPHDSLFGLWESLVFNDNIPEKLLDYVTTSLIFSDRAVDTNLISWNKLVLLHGPPGTGKTSLCKALAQKLSIRLSNTYTTSKLIEINSHSLFSKFFSESGKLVFKMFQMINGLVDDDKNFVCVLIDEVESLTSARKSCNSGMEPSDSIRVVNALLTQLDQLKKRKNVLVLTTSNITEAIDGAFIDRADLKIHIAEPGVLGVYSILSSCVDELVSRGLICLDEEDEELMNWKGWIGRESTEGIDDASSLLYEIALICESSKLSGRTLRKLPFLTFAFSSTLKSQICSSRGKIGMVDENGTLVDEDEEDYGVDLFDYLSCLMETVKDEVMHRGKMTIG